MISPRSIRLQNDSPGFNGFSMGYISHPSARYSAFPRSFRLKIAAARNKYIVHTFLSDLTHARIFSYRNRINDK